MSVLGIDLGTTSVKVTLYDEAKQEVVISSSQPSCAYVDSEFREQDVTLIWLSLEALLASLDVEKLRHIRRVAVCCQMHGVVLWRKQSSPDAPLEASHLITWEDQRCDEGFLKSLPLSKFQKISTGFGCASLFWLERHRRAFLDSWDFAGTVGDLLVSRLTGLQSYAMSPHNAAFWGYFDVAKAAWEEDVLRPAGFPMRLLPPVQPCGHVVGRVTDAWAPLPSGAAVTVAIGDLQASTLAATWGRSDAAVLNIGTSAQLILPRPPAALPPSLLLVPYFGTNLAVAASLNGGNVLSHFVTMLRSWLQDLGLQTPGDGGGDVQKEDALWARLAALAEAGEAEEAPRIGAQLFGERHAPGACCEVLGVKPGPGLRLGPVFAALCLGVTRNLREMAAEVLRPGATRVLGCGSALRRNSALRKAFLETFADCRAEILEQDGDASLGAALSVCEKK